MRCIELGFVVIVVLIVGYAARKPARVSAGSVPHTLSQKLRSNADVGL